MMRIKKLTNRIIRRLREQRGESISEVLIASLIVALGGVAFVSMVTVSRTVIARSGEGYTKWMTERNIMEEIESCETAGDVPSFEEIETGNGRILITAPEGQPVETPLLGSAEDVTTYEGDYFWAFKGSAASSGVSGGEPGISFGF